MGKRGRPPKNPIKMNWNKTAGELEREYQFDRDLNKLTKMVELKILEKALKHKPTPEEDFLRLTGRMGANNYDINIKTMEDQRMAASLLNQFGIYLIRKDH